MLSTQTNPEEICKYTIAVVDAENALDRLLMKNTANCGEHGELQNVGIHIADECELCLGCHLRYALVCFIAISTKPS